MIDALRLLLPIGLAAYCFIRAVRRPIFLLGIPFLQVMRVSVFFDALKLFWLPGAWGGSNAAVLLWIALTWVWCAYRSSAEARQVAAAARRPLRVLPEEYLLAALAALVFVKLVWGGFGPAETGTWFTQLAQWILLPVGYWLVRGVVRRSNSEDVRSFLLFVAVATTIASGLFILHQGLRIPLYQVKEYLVFTFGGETLSRTYWFMSPFLLVPLAVGLARRSWSVGIIVLVVVSLVAVVVSYTRNYLVAATAIIAILLALRSFKERRLGSGLLRLATVGGVLAIVVVVLLVALPTPTGFFLSRMASLTHASTTVEDPNLLVRYSDLKIVTASLNERNLLLVGATFGAVGNMADTVTKWTADSTWVGLTYWTGLIGAALILGVFFFFGLRALRLFWSRDKTTEFLGAVFFALIVATFINSLTGWTFLDPNTSAMGLWLFAFVAGEATRTNGVGVGLADDLAAQDAQFPERRSHVRHSLDAPQRGSGLSSRRTT
jgi:hypothetical protein